MAAAAAVMAGDDDDVRKSGFERIHVDSRKKLKKLL